MPRKKIEFTEEQNLRITHMVEINKSLQEITDDFEKNFNIKVSLPTIQKQIEILGLNREDGRKYSGNHKKGYYTEESSSNNKPLSKYKLKKLDCYESFPKDKVKGLGYGKDGLPLNYKLIKDKTGEVEEIEMIISLDDVKYSGGKDCEKGSERWWNIERMRFDLGCVNRGLLEGQIKGDWRGVVKRFLYDADGNYRFDKFDIVKEQQEAWERYVESVYDKVIENDKKKNLDRNDIHNNNKYIINGLSKKDMMIIMDDAPELIFRYIPSHLYGRVVHYCIDKMYDDNRLSSDQSIMAETLKNIMTHTKIKINNDELDKITLDVVKQCLSLNPNEYDTAIRYCCLYAIQFNLIDMKYIKVVLDIISKLRFKCVDSKYTLNGLDWTSVVGDHKNDLKDVVEMKEKKLNEICEKFGLTL